MAAEPHGRYLFAGDVEGRLNLLFKRAAAVNKSNGPFDCLFCVGAFFPPSDPATAAAGGAGGQSELEDYIAGRAKAPLPTFLIGDIGVGAQRLLEIAVRGGGGAATRKEGEAAEEKVKEEGKEEQKEEAEEGGKGEGEEKGEGEDKGEGEEKGEGEDKGEGEEKGEGEDKGEGEEKGEGEDKGEGEEKGEGEDKGEGEEKGEGEDKGEGEEKEKGEETREGEGDGSKAVGEAGEGEESKGEVGAGTQGGGSGGGEKEEDEEVGEGEWRSHRRVKICDNIEWLRGAGIADLCGQMKPSPLCLPPGSNPPYLSSTPPLPSLFRPTGLKVAYLGGRYDPATYLSGQAGGTGVAEGRQERAAVEALVDAGADGAAIDVLLTNEWPKGVAALTHPSLLPSPPPATSASAPASVDWAGVGSPVAATLAKELMPRYHVAGGAGAFFARPPYINSSAATSAEDASTSASGPVTRFIGLAPVGNKAKQKFLHALSLRPASSLPLSDLAARPPDATPSPFLPRPTSAKNQIWTGSLAAPDGAARAAAAAAQAKAEETAAKRTFWESSDGGKGGGEGAVKPAWALKVEEEEARGAGGAGEGEQYWRYAAGKKRARRDGGPGGGGREGPQVCFELSGKGVCSRGDACRFMHTLEDGSPLPRNLCFEHFSKGSCSRGTDCRFRHSLAGGEAGGGAGEGQGGGGNAAAGSVAAAVATAAAVAAAAGVGGSSGGATDLPKGVCFDLVRRGSCTRGDTCRFAHSLPSTSPGLLATPPPLTPASLAALLAPPAAGGPAGGATGGAGGAGGAAPPTPAPCWFCLASPKVETHLVVSVGEHCYVALPKGPLVPGHVLILPIEHFPSVISLPSDALAEMWRYMGALRKCFEAQGQTVVAFERFLQLRAATHAHVNVVPIPQGKADQVLPAFTAAAASHNFQFASVPKPPDGQHMAVVDEVKKQSRGGQYLTVELPDASLLVHAIDRGAKLPMQLGREVRGGWASGETRAGERCCAGGEEVVAGVVGVPERGDWRACKETAEEEAAMADAFKKQFQPFDIMG
ncbi:unnamed protein product [Closterium sp. NIES-65]|nr:unnamed protein product [Closterium sp. NIES-65]